MPDLPTGTVTLLFTDIAGSTKLLHQLGPDAYGAQLDGHRRLLRAAFAAHGGVEIDTQGDAFFVAFPEARGAVAAARDAQTSLEGRPISVRMGLHTGSPQVGPEGYVGADVHLAARIAGAGHGGQILLSQATRGLVDGSLTDLGEHRLKDFADPVRIFQVGNERFPPLKAISNTNLPRPASTFIGRAREIADVTALLRDGARLLTLTGPGGTGKTRLSIEAASELVADFKGGVFWIAVAALRDPALVIPTIAQTVGAKDDLVEFVADREMLLVTDNLEQVVEAATDLASLVEACPNLRVMTTSRELLRVRGEVEYPVPPLAEPDAVELFAARSGLAVDETVVELCRRLESLPLAVELAAARTSVLSPAQILERLSTRLDLLKGGRDADPRQQTLRATIGWSHDLLAAPEKTLFARLSVFRGGCILEAAEEIVGADIDTLQSLVDKSLLRHSDERFWMLETIREYAAERLDESGEANETGRRHAAYFLALADRAEPGTREFTTEKEWLDRLERDLENLRAALDWFEISGASQLVLQLAGALRGYWGTRGFLNEGWHRLQRALEMDVSPTAARARALNGAADLGGIGRGDAKAAKFWAKQALSVHRGLGDYWGAAEALFLLAHAAADQEEFAAARDNAVESMELFEIAGDQQYVTAAMWMLGWAHKGLGDRDRARELYENVLDRARSSGATTLRSLVLYSLSGIALEEKRAVDALPFLEEAYDLDRATGNTWRLAGTACRLGSVLAVLGNPFAATRVFSAGQSLLEEMGGSIGSRAAEDDETLASLQVQLDDEAFSKAWEEGKGLGAEEAVALTLGELDLHA